MDALAQHVEVLAAVGAADHDLTVQHPPPVRELQLREIASQRPAVA
jgi:hypothetical protein